MKQMEKFLMMLLTKKLFYLGKLRKSLAYHFNMVNSVFYIYITALFEAK